MRKVSYSKFSEEDLGIEMEDLLRALSDYFLQSGFQDPYLQATEFDQHTLEELKRAIEQALESGELFDPDQLEAMQERLAADVARKGASNCSTAWSRNSKQAGLINKEGQPPGCSLRTGGQDGKEGEVRFEVTDKAVDFLGFKTLKDLLGSLGKSSFGAHDTRDLQPGSMQAAAPSATNSETL